MKRKFNIKPLSTETGTSEYTITQAFDARDTYYIRPRVVGKCFYDPFIKAHSCCITISADSVEKAFYIFLSRGYIVKDDLVYTQ